MDVDNDHTQSLKDIDAAGLYPPLVLEAMWFANKAHYGQVRKYTGAPYIEHPRAVCALVATVPHTQAMLCAAWLHDVVEDCHVGLEEIEARFGHDVAVLVEMLTDVSTPGDGNRAARKGVDLLHTQKASPQAKTIKLADLIDNSESILARDKDFARVYLREKMALLRHALREGDRSLWWRAYGIAADGLDQLGEPVDPPVPPR
jgi:(p)ppGpp synthase/HD superfamily hydrolase